MLIAAPTGTGKTLAGFLTAINDLYRTGDTARPPRRGTSVVYISPLKALAIDVHQNLEGPLAGIAHCADAAGLPDPELSVGVRTGDTPASERTAMVASPPDLLVTTPESLYLLLTASKGRETLRNVGTVIVDEIHALAGDKRGAHLRDAEISLCLPASELAAVAPDGQFGEILELIAKEVRSHRTTLIFVNTRRMAERVAHLLAERFDEEIASRVCAHHGSLSKERRLLVESRLRAGELSALVATASLELGIDIGPVDLVCQIGSPRSIATCLQRVGRANHSLGGTPKGLLFPMTRDELSDEVSLLRSDVDSWLASGPQDTAAARLSEQCSITAEAASRIVSYLAAAQSALGTLPTRNRIVFERFFDEAGGMQLVVHAPFGGRINRAFGLALRKRFCATFDFELQAAANDDAVVLSLGPQHSFPLSDAARLLRSPSVSDVLTQAVLASPLFTARWRWNLNRSLVVLRQRGGARNPLPIQRMESDERGGPLGAPAGGGTRPSRGIRPGRRIGGRAAPGPVGSGVLRPRPAGALFHPVARGPLGTPPPGSPRSGPGRALRHRNQRRAVRPARGGGPTPCNLPLDGILPRTPHRSPGPAPSSRSGAGNSDPGRDGRPVACSPPIGHGRPVACDYAPLCHTRHHLPPGLAPCSLQFSKVRPHCHHCGRPTPRSFRLVNRLAVLPGDLTGPLHR